jgi:signal transduction histidine kinase
MAAPQRITRSRIAVSLVVLLPVLTALIASLPLTTPGTAREPSCWLLPNSRVLVPPGDTRCPLESHDQITAVRTVNGLSPVYDSRGVHRAIRADGAASHVEVQVSGSRDWRRLPIRTVSRRQRLTEVLMAGMVAAAVLTIPAFLLWNASTRAAIPFSLAYGAIAVIAISAMAGRSSEVVIRLAMLAFASLPAALTHLALVFPRDRRFVQEAPQLQLLPYVMLLFLVPSGFAAIHRDPLLWPVLMFVLEGATAAAWLVLIASCVFAIRESTSPLERARARLLCWGAIVLPIAPTLALVPSAPRASEIATAYLWSAAAALPLPIGLAISRYNLFDLVGDVRRWFGRLAYVGFAASVVAFAAHVGLPRLGGEPFAGPISPVFLLAFVAIASAELLRGRLIGAWESVALPHIRFLRELREQFVRDTETLADDEAVAQRLAAAIETALTPRFGCVFLDQNGVWRPAASFGDDAPIEADLAARTLRQMGGRGLVHLAREEFDGGREFESLLGRGIEALAAIRAGRRPLGLLVVGARENRTPYSGAELDFVEVLTAQAGVALENARRAEELVAIERHATAGRVAVAVAHDLGKEIDWIARLARRLPERIEDPIRAKRDLEQIQDLATSVVEALREFVEQSTRSHGEEAADIRLDSVVQSALRRVERSHGGERVLPAVEPAAAAERAHPALASVMSAVLDNALRASAPDELVRLFATVEDGVLHLVIEDQGEGMLPETRVRVFQPGFSTRAKAGGLGVGLTAAREIVASLGGSISLESEPGLGTRVAIEVPLGRQPR